MTRMAFPSERTIEDYLEREIRRDGFCSVTDDRPDFYIRQLAITGYGVSDLVLGYSEQIYPEKSPGVMGVRLNVIELKNETLKEQHLSQLARYMTGLKRACNERFKSLGWPPVDVFGTLAGPFSTENDLCFLLNLMEESQIDVVDLSMTFEEGFKSEIVGHSWHKKGADIGFTEKIVSEAAAGASGGDQ